MKWQEIREILFKKKREPDDLLKLRTKYKDVFSTPTGEDVLCHICKEGHVFHTTFVENDPHQTVLNEGRRQLALAILRAVDSDFEKLKNQNETTQS